MSTLMKLPQMSPKRVANKGTNQGRALKAETFAMSRLTFNPIVFPMACVRLPIRQCREEGVFGHFRLLVAGVQNVRHPDGVHRNSP